MDMYHIFLVRLTWLGNLEQITWTIAFTDAAPLEYVSEISRHHTVFVDDGLQSDHLGQINTIEVVSATCESRFDTGQ